MSYQIELQDKSSVEKSLTISIERSAFDGRYQKELVKLTSQAHIKGFRPGRAPRAMVAKTYGTKIYDEVLNNFVNEALRETLEKNKLPVIDTSISEFKGGDDDKANLTVNMILSLYPEPKLKSYKGLEVEYPVTLYKESILTDRLNQLQTMMSNTAEVTDRTKVLNTDIVTMSYDASFEGKKDDKLSAVDQVVELGKQQLPEEIEKGIVGSEVGAKKIVNYTFPEAASAELKGKEYAIEITITKIEERVLPELNDEFAKKTGIGETLDDLKSFIEKQAKVSIDSENKESRNSAILDEIIKVNEFEIPQVLIDREIRQMLAEMKLLNPKDKNFHNSPIDNYRHIMSEKSSERVKRYVAIESLLKEENIEALEEDVEKFLDKVSAESGMTRDQVNNEYQYPKQMDGLKRLASVTTLFDMLASASKLKEKEKVQESEV